MNKLETQCRLKVNTQRLKGTDPTKVGSLGKDPGLFDSVCIPLLKNYTSSCLTLRCLVNGHVRSLLYFYRPQRSCGKKMFLHLCVSHSVYRGCLPPPLGRPPGQTPPTGQTAPGRPPWAAPLPSACWDTHPPGHTPPCPVHAGIHPPAQCMLGYGQKAGGTHPTGMHTC